MLYTFLYFAENIRTGSYSMYMDYMLENMCKKERKVRGYVFTEKCLGAANETDWLCSLDRK
jgi:hypothetical protein